MIHKGLFRETKIHYRWFLAVVVVSISSGSLAIGQAWLIAAIINNVFLENGSINDVKNWLAVLAAVSILRAFLVFIGENAGYRFADAVKENVRHRITTHLLALGPVPLASQNSGELINVLAEGIESLEAYFARYLPQLITAALLPPMILGFVFFHDTVSALLMLVTAPLIPFFMVLIGKMAEKKNKQQWEKLSRLSAHFLDVLQGLTTLKLFGRSRDQVQVIAKMSGEFRDTTLEVLRVAFLSALTLELFATISTALVAVTVGIKLLFGELEFRDAFFVLLLAPEYYLPLRQLGTHFHSGMTGAAAAEKIYAILALPMLPKGTGSQPFYSPTSVAVEFDCVQFSYGRDKQPALDRVSFSLSPGEQVALVGATGAGKSTVAGLMLRFIEPSAGMVRVNGQELSSLDRKDWLAHVAYVPQNPHLFAGTVADNIAFGMRVSRDKIVEAAKQAQAHDFISELPSGYDTVVGEGGRGLSGGERQRLAIARAMVKDAPLVILDEATASLDYHTEEQIQTALDSLLVRRTALIIAHRLQTVVGADRIIVLKGGRVAEIGTHAELLEQQGEYCRMVSAFQGHGKGEAK